jgi:hypothetical protein
MLLACDSAQVDMTRRDQSKGHMEGFRWFEWNLECMREYILIGLLNLEILRRLYAIQ